VSEPTQTESSATGPKPKKGRKKQGRHITWVTALLGLLSAILLLASGYLGYLAEQNNLAASQANERAAEAKSTVAAQSSTIDTLTSDQAINSSALQAAQSSVSVLASQNSLLSSQLANLTTPVSSSSSAPPGPTFTTAPAAVSVRNPNPIYLRPGSPHIDLDSTEANWATDPANEAGADLSFYSPEDRLAMGYGTRMSLLQTTPANYDNCKASYAGMSSGEEKIGEFKVSDNVCVLTGESRYVALVVTSVTDGIHFNATSYDPPGR